MTPTKTSVLAFIPAEDRLPTGSGSQPCPPPSMAQAIQQALDARTSAPSNLTKTEEDNIKKQEKEIRDTKEDDLPKGMVEKEEDNKGEGDEEKPEDKIEDKVDDDDAYERQVRAAISGSWRSAVVM
jgi:hypothetical protein